MAVGLAGLCVRAHCQLPHAAVPAPLGRENIVFFYNILVIAAWQSLQLISFFITSPAVPGLASSLEPRLPARLARYGYSGAACERACVRAGKQASVQAGGRCVLWRPW